MSSVLITLALAFNWLGVWAEHISHSEDARVGFRRYSLFGWSVWLAPRYGGMLLGMSSV